MARPKQFERAAVLASIQALFRTSGFAGTSLSALEAATGVGRQSLYDTFGDKAAMFAVALSQEVAEEEARLARLFDEAAGGLGALQRYLVERVHRLDTESGCLLTVAALERGSQPDVRSVLQAVQSRRLGVVATVLSMAARRGEIRTTPSVPALARVVNVHWDSVAIRWGGGIPKAEILAEVDVLQSLMRIR